ncbi:hypothetical protein BG004_004313 [Podila humilis]|nr:hypothetical protein BG004_004313 [Podila humilis]
MTLPEDQDSIHMVSKQGATSSSIALKSDRISGNSLTTRSPTMTLQEQNVQKPEHESAEESRSATTRQQARVSNSAISTDTNSLASRSSAAANSSSSLSSSSSASSYLATSALLKPNPFIVQGSGFKSRKHSSHRNHESDRFSDYSSESSSPTDIALASTKSSVASSGHSWPSIRPSTRFTGGNKLLNEFDQDDDLDILVFQQHQLQQAQQQQQKQYSRRQQKQQGPVAPLYSPSIRAVKHFAPEGDFCQKYYVEPSQTSLSSTLLRTPSKKRNHQGKTFRSPAPKDLPLHLIYSDPLRSFKLKIPQLPCEENQESHNESELGRDIELTGRAQRDGEGGVVNGEEGDKEDNYRTPERNRRSTLPLMRLDRPFTTERFTQSSLRAPNRDIEKNLTTRTDDEGLLNEGGVGESKTRSADGELEGAYKCEVTESEEISKVGETLGRDTIDDGDNYHHPDNDTKDVKDNDKNDSVEVGNPAASPSIQTAAVLKMEKQPLETVSGACANNNISNDNNQLSTDLQDRGVVVDRATLPSFTSSRLSSSFSRKLSDSDFHTPPRKKPCVDDMLYSAIQPPPAPFVPDWMTPMFPSRLNRVHVNNWLREYQPSSSSSINDSPTNKRTTSSYRGGSSRQTQIKPPSNQVE